MSLPRRVVRTALAGALVALATVVGGASAHAGNTICVALVVDFGDLGGGVQTSCATVQQGATGYDVLEAGGHTFTICSNGVLGSIDGKPSDGCQEKNDSVHYWSYWHRAPGRTTWTYSNEGAGTYQPQNSSTEGWRWMKTPPANVPYSQICKPTASPQPTTTHTASRRPTTSQPATARTASSSGTTTPTPTVNTSASTTARHRHRVTQHAATTRTPTATPTPAATPHVLAADPPITHSGSNAGRIAVVAAALLVVGGIGTAAWLRGRRGQPT